MAINQKLIPTKINLDLAPEYFDGKTARFIKNLTPYVSTTNENSGATEGKNSGKQKPLQSNELYVNVPLPEGSIKVGDFSSKETNEVFICIYNSDKQHLIYRINGNSRTVEIVYHGQDLKFKLNPENFIAEGSAWLEVIYLTDPATGNKIRRTFFMYTDAINYQRQIAVEDSIATDSFNENIYPYFKGNYDKEILINMGLSTPKTCIKITEVVRTKKDYGLINNLLFNTWQFRITDIDVWGRPSEHSIISDIYIPGINDCFSSSPNLSRCLNLHFNAGSPIVDKKQIEFRNCNSTQWYLDSVIDLYEGSSIGSWWLRPRNPKINYNSNDNTIDYTFCRTREKNAIPETETSRLFNPLARQSAALTKIADVIALSNNKDGFIPFSQDLKDKIKIIVEPPKDIAITPSRNIEILVAIYNGHYHSYQQVHKDGTSGYIWGDTNHDPRKYSQYFTNIQQSGFGGYLLGSGAVAFSTQVYVGENGEIIDDPEFKGQTLSPIGLTFQKFVFNAVPAGVYVFRLFSHLTDLSLTSNYQETSTTVYDRCPFSPVNFSIDVFARQNSKEIIVDVCDKDYDTLKDNKILVIADLAYYRARATCGYIYETRRNGFSENPMELLNVYNPVAERNGACDHNGFYYIESDQNGRTFSFNFKYKCAPAEYDLGTPANEGMSFSNLYIDELRKFHAGQQTIEWADYYTLPCNRILIKGTVFLQDRNIGVPNVTVVLTRGRTAITDDNGNYTIIAHDDNNLLYRNDEILLSGSTCNYTSVNDGCIKPIQVHITLCSACEERILNVEDFLVNYFSQRGLLSGGTYAVGCTAWDWLGRGTYTQGLEIINIPTITESKTIGASKILAKINPNALFPKEFEYLTFWITDELTIEAYLSWIVDRAEFIDNTGNINIAAPSQIRIYYSSLNEFNKQNNFNTTTNWQFIAPAAEGSTTQLPYQNDVVQFYLNGDGLFFPKLITALVKYDQEGQYFLIDYTDDLKDLKQNALIRLVRPKTTVSETQPFFEVCHIVNLKNGVAQDNEFYLNFFDTYYLNRQIPVPTPVTPTPTVTQIATTVGDVTTYETPVPAATAIELRVFGFPFEHDSPSNFWGKGCKNIGRVNVKNPYETEVFHLAQIARSGVLSGTGQLNYLNYFDDDKKETFNQPNFSITAVFYDMGVVFVLGQYDNFIVGYNDNLARVNSAGNIQVPSGANSFGKPERKLGSNYGCQLYDKNTIKKRNGLISFVDANRGEAVQFNYSSIESYTKGQCDSWFRKKVKLVQERKGDKYFVAGISPITNEYFITDFSLNDRSYINDLRDVAVPITIITENKKSLSNGNGSHTTTIALPNVFGALIAGTELSNSEKADVLLSLKAKYGRLSIFLTSFSGSNGQYNAYVSAGIKVVLNINNQPVVSDVPNPYPTDLTAYGNSINDVLLVYQPELIVIENEEQNEGYYTGTPEQYIAMLEVAIPLCHTAGCKVADGGLLYAPIAALIYWEMLDNGQTAQAANFLTYNVPSSYWNRFQHPDLHPDWVAYVAQFTTLIDYFATSDLDYVNFHIYEPANMTTANDNISQPTPDAINKTVEYLKRKTGKEIITNEIGQKNINADLTANIMQLAVDNELPYAIWYSGDSDVGQHAKALTESDGTLRVTGERFAEFISFDLVKTVIVSDASSNTSANILYGFNGNMAFAPIPYSSPLLLNNILTIPITVERYPGGNVANRFNWHTGKDDDGSGYANTLSDILALRNARGCDICFVLNMLTHTMADQILMLTTAEGMGIPIRYVELGNEFNNVNNPGHTVFPTPQDYADEAKIWKAAIKAQFPLVMVGVIGENKTWAGGENWNDVMLTINPDAIILHEYADPDLFSLNGVANMAQLDSVILDDFISSGMKLITTVPIWITEYNWKVSGKNGDNFLTYDSQIATTLRMTQKLTALISANNSSGLKLMMANNIDGKQGAFSITNDSVTIQPTGIAMQEFLNNLLFGDNSSGFSTFTTKILAPNETVSFDMITREMRAFFGFTPEGFSYLDGDLLNVQMFTFKNGQPYSHYNINKNNSYNKFYDVQCEKVFRTIFNVVADTKKLMLSVIVNCQNENYFSDQILTDSKQFSRLLLAAWDKGDYFYAAAIQCDLNTTYDPNLPDETGQNKLLDGDKLYGEILDIRLVGEPDKMEQYSELLDVIVIAFPQTTNASV